jgi:hypothetical protein
VTLCSLVGRCQNLEGHNASVLRSSVQDHMDQNLEDHKFKILFYLCCMEHSRSLQTVMCYDTMFMFFRCLSDCFYMLASYHCTINILFSSPLLRNLKGVQNTFKVGCV